MHSSALGFFMVHLYISFYVYGQQYPSFFDKQDLKDHGFLNTYRNPNPIPHLHHSKQTQSQDLTDRPYEVPKIRPSVSEIGHGSGEDLALLAERLTKADKWDEFISETDQLKEQYEGKVMPNWEKDRDKWVKYSKGLQDYIPNPRPRGVNPNPPPLRGIPSVGLETYWGEEDIDKEITQYRNYGIKKQDPRIIPQSSGFGEPISGNQLMEIAVKKLSQLQTPGKKPENNQPSGGPLESTAHYTENFKTPQQAITAPPSLLRTTPSVMGHNASYERNMPKVDDFGSPVRWVSYNSNDTDDGLAKVTDLSTGRNRQFLINTKSRAPASIYNIS